MQNTFINLGIILTYILLFVTVLAALIFPLIQTFGNLKAAKNGLLGVGALLLVFLISFLVSPAETGTFYDKFGISPTLSKAIGGGIIATYIIFIGAAISILYTQVAKFFR